MLKSDLIKRLTDNLTEKFPETTEKIVAESTCELIKHIINTLIEGGRMEIRGFASIASHYQAAGAGRNPKTGQRVNIPARYRVRFKAAKKLRLRLNASYR